MPEPLKILKREFLDGLTLDIYEVEALSNLSFFSYLLAPANPNEINPLIFFIPGSGWQSILGFMKRHFLSFVQKYEMPILTLDKKGIQPNEKRNSKPKGFYLEHDNKHDRVKEAIEALHFIKPNTRCSSSPIYLIGFSEGVDIAANVANFIINTKTYTLAGIILIGGGGYDAIKELQIGIKKFNKIPCSKIKSLIDHLVDSYLERIKRKILAHPTTKRKFLGLSWKRWASYSQASPVNDLLVVNSPLLILHGEKDRNVPIESAYYLKEQLEAVGKSKIAFKEFLGLDHHFRDKDGKEHLDKVLDYTFHWIFQNFSEK